MVSFEDTVITVGGNKDGDDDSSGHFYQLKCDKKLSCQWTKMAQKMKQQH